MCVLNISQPAKIFHNANINSITSLDINLFKVSSANLSINFSCEDNREKKTQSSKMNKIYFSFN